MRLTINGPLADRGQGTRRNVVVLALALGFDVAVDVVGDDLVCAARPLLVDQRGAFAVVTHARHQILDPGAADRGEGIAGVSKVVEVQAFSADRPDRVGHPDILPKLLRRSGTPLGPQNNSAPGSGPTKATAPRAAAAAAHGRRACGLVADPPRGAAGRAGSC
jgi:hypothetical protein